MPSARIIRSIAHWPTVFELDLHETFEMATATGPRRITLLSVEEFTEPDFWIKDNPAHKTIASARITLDISGETVTLLLRPYEMPITVAGLRLYVETTRHWATTQQLHPVADVQRAVRLSAIPAGEPWGPPTIRFPLADFRWRSSSYQNTWCSLVPFNAHYYHRGEDFGSIPGSRAVRAMFDGRVTNSPLPAGDGKSNGLEIASSDGMSLRVAHMDIESVDPSLTQGVMVRAGQPLAKTGMTWDGRKSQTHDPHLHLQFNFGETFISPYPTIVEAYLRDYPDPLLAIAGGYAFGLLAQPVEFDASRSLARAGKTIVRYRWTLPNGQHAESPIARVTFDRPGYYAVPLEVWTAEGEMDRDFLQVRIYDPSFGENREIAFGWLHAHPTRNVQPGVPVTLWNRLIGTRDTQVDWGDGTKESTGPEATHAYARPGIFTIAVTGQGPREEPVTACLRVLVE